MILELDGNAIKIQGQIEDAVLVQILTESAKESSVEEAFLEIVMLGAKVKEVIQTTATTQLLAKSVDDVREGLEKLATDHEEFLRDLLAEISDESSDSDLNLIKKLKDWREEFDEKLELEFDDTNSEGAVAKIKAAVDAYLTKRESAIASLLSLNEPDNALVPRPLKQVYDKAQAILDKLNEDKGAKKAGRGAAKKGNDFESAVFNIIQAISDEYGDVADDPGRQRAIGLDGNDEGDVTVEYRFDSINNVVGKLVIEAKHHNTKTSKPKLLGELEKGVSNREGDYGILVTNESGYSLDGKFPFWEDWGNRRAILVLEDDHENLDEDKVRFAYLLAKARIKDIKANLDAETLEHVNEQVATIKANFARVTHLKGAHTRAIDALGEILTDVEFLEKNVGKELERLHKEITGVAETED
jgi:hypothetical protein